MAQIGLGAYPDDPYYDPNRPSWVPYWIDTPTESQLKYQYSQNIAADAAANAGGFVGGVVGGVAAGAVGTTANALVGSVNWTTWIVVGVAAFLLLQSRR